MISQPGGRKISDISDFWPSFSYFHISQSDRNASFFRFVINEGVDNDDKDHTYVFPKYTMVMVVILSSW